MYKWTIEEFLSLIKYNPMTFTEIIDHYSNMLTTDQIVENLDLAKKLNLVLIIDDVYHVSYIGMLTSLNKQYSIEGLMAYGLLKFDELLLEIKKIRIALETK